MNLAEHVRRERTLRYPSARAAALAGGISNTLWSRFENSGHVTDHVRHGVAQAFGWSTDWPENPPELTPPLDDDVRLRVRQLQRVVVALGSAAELLLLDDLLELSPPAADELREALRAVQ